MQQMYAHIALHANMTGFLLICHLQKLILLYWPLDGKHDNT